MIKEQWKNMIFSEENLRDNFLFFIDDYLRLKEYYMEHENQYQDDATWIHVDVAKEEREELESEILNLKEALDKRNEEYLELYNMYQAVLKANEGQGRDDKPKKKLLKARKPTISFKNVEEEDDIPF